MLVAFVLLAFCAGLGVKHWRKSERWLPCKRGSNSDSNMQAIGFQEALEKIFKDDSRYHAEAYVFLRDALEATLKRQKEGSQGDFLPCRRGRVAGGISDPRLAGVRSNGHHRLRVLGGALFRRHWQYGVQSCPASGIFGKTDEDTLESFREGYDFADAFVLPFRPEPEKLSVIGSGVVGKKA